jgi:hypothetical protein
MKSWLLPRLPLIAACSGFLAVYVPTIMFYAGIRDAFYDDEENVAVIRTISDASSRVPGYNVFASGMAVTAGLLIGSTFVVRFRLLKQWGGALHVSVFEGCVLRDSHLTHIPPLHTHTHSSPTVNVSPSYY